MTIIDGSLPSFLALLGQMPGPVAKLDTWLAAISEHGRAGSGRDRFVVADLYGIAAEGPTPEAAMDTWIGMAAWLVHCEAVVQTPPQDLDADQLWDRAATVRTLSRNAKAIEAARRLQDQIALGVLS